jgi:hypothetical protein
LGGRRRFASVRCFRRAEVCLLPILIEFRLEGDPKG